MKKILILAGVALCCLFNQPKSSFAEAKTNQSTLPAEKLTYASLINRQIITDYSGYYNNATSNQIQVWFMDPGNDNYPQHVIFLTANTNSGTFTVVSGTYDVKFFSPNNLSVTIVGAGKSASGANPFISSVNFSGSAVTFNIYNQ